ncbi:MAG: hypothetical protein AAFO94_19550 [Bacteroidota bacterium]
MNDQKWAYKQKYRVAKAIFFTLLFHAALVWGITLAAGGEVSEWIPDFLKTTTPEKVELDQPVV